MHSLFKPFRSMTLILALTAISLVACGKQKYQNHPDDGSSAESEAAIEQPNLREALGLQGPVQYLGVFTEDMDKGDMNYDTYEFDRDGHLVSICVAETVEGSYSETMAFGDDGLPMCDTVIFINYWIEEDVGDNYPVTTTSYKMKRETDGDYIVFTKELVNVGVKNPPKNSEEVNPDGEEQGAPQPFVRVKLDKQGRIVEVIHLEGEPKHFTYTYDDKKSNVAHRDDGKLAIPQADMMGAKHFDYEGLKGQRASAESLMRGIWEFNIKNFE